MKISGIVCEYNPFHNGHKRQIDILRQNGTEIIVCAMSGNYTQRGEFAIVDKYTRAEAAVRCGADIVVELPFPYSSLSAEGFCRAGVHILSQMGIDTLCFGSESANKAMLSKAADAILTDSFATLYTEYQQQMGTAKAYFHALSCILNEDVAPLSNDILALSYLCAIKREGTEIVPYPIKRDGAAYNSEALDPYKNPSATAIRKALLDQCNPSALQLESYIPSPAVDVLQQAALSGHFPIFSKNADKEIISFFRLMTPNEITNRAVYRSGGGYGVAEDGCGLVSRLCESALSSCTIDELLDKAYNSRYPNARVNRVMLFSLFGVSDAISRSLPSHTTLLAINEKGRCYLSSRRKSASFPIISKPADAPDNTVTKLSNNADAFYASALLQNDQEFFIKKHPFLIK